MVPDIYIKPGEIWDYFQRNSDRLAGEREIIAEVQSYGIEVTLTNNNGKPCIEVFSDYVQVFKEEPATKEVCDITAKEVYDTYLSDGVFSAMCDFVGEDLDKTYDEYVFNNQPSSIEGADGMSDAEIEEMIADREEELNELICGFLEDTVEDFFVQHDDDKEDIVEDIKEHLLEYIARTHGLSVYRPMILEDEDGEDFFTEYPYEHMVFDDDK